MIRGKKKISNSNKSFEQQVKKTSYNCWERSFSDEELQIFSQELSRNKHSVTWQERVFLSRKNFIFSQIKIYAEAA